MKFSYPEIKLEGLRLDLLGL